MPSGVSSDDHYFQCYPKVPVNTTPSTVSAYTPSAKRYQVEGLCTDRVHLSERIITNSRYGDECVG